MATSYPEGECFFRRSSLVYPGWSAQSADQFYSHVLVEYFWNGWVAKDQRYPNIQHPRAKLLTDTPDGVGKHTGWYSHWDTFSVAETYDVAAMRDQSRVNVRVDYTQSNNYNESRDRARNHPRKYIIRPILINDRKTEWLWIDGTIPIRAIYFPVAQQSDEAFQDYCTYVVIDFRARQSVQLYNCRNQTYQTFKLTPEYGLDYCSQMTFGFNVPNIIAYLALPRQVRDPEQGLFRAMKRGDELVMIHDAVSYSAVRSPAVPISRVFHREMDLAKIICATFGIEVGWRPHQYSSFLRDLLVTVLDTALGLVPGVGPLLSVSFGIALQLIEDPGSFSTENVLDLNAAAMDSMVDSGKRGKKYMARNLFAASVKSASAITDEDRKAGDALNAHLTAIIRERLEGKDPPQSLAWLERIADSEKFIADPDGVSNEGGREEGSEELQLPHDEVK